MIPSDVKFKSLMNPGLVTFNNITYVVPGWHVVPSDTTLDEVKEHWEKETFELDKFSINPESPLSETVVSSRTGEKYEVRFSGRYWSCTCMGFSFKGRCKHVEQIKLKYND